jgi:cytochrome c oxidase subunit 2
MSKVKGSFMGSGTAWAGLAAVAGVLSSGVALAADTMDNAYWNLPKGVTDISHDVFTLHMAAFWMCVVIGILVFGVMFYSIFAHRRSKHPKPADFHHSTTVEILWTIVPFVILIALAVPAAGTLIKEYDTRNSDMTVKITGYQWKWQYEYVDQGVSFFSTLEAKANAARQLHSGIDPATVPNYLHDTDHYLVLPVGKKVRFLLTANDVIHGWWMPDFAIKKDAIPGYINEMWTKINEPGIYRGQCTVLCGRDHGFMPIVVKAVTLDEYNVWLKQQQDAVGFKPAQQVASNAPTTANDAVPVEPVAAAPIAPATSPATASATPTLAAPATPPTQVAAADSAKPAVAAAPAAKMDKAALVTAGAKVYTANCQACHQATGQGMPPTFPSLVGDKIVAGPVEAHITQVLKGKNAMPPFASLSDTDIAAVVTYERNSWGNASGEAQPAQVTALRGK